MSRAWIATALVALAVVALASIAIPFAAEAGSGLVFATMKVIVLAVVFVRVSRHDAYAMQWSSMLILLYFAEGLVRATSDSASTASLGAVAATASAAYFVAMLALLRPLKRAARSRRT